MVSEARCRDVKAVMNGGLGLILCDRCLKRLERQLEFLRLEYEEWLKEKQKRLDREAQGETDE